MDESLDAGSIPANSMKKSTGRCFFCGVAGIERRDSIERPSGSFRSKPGLKGGRAAGGIPANSTLPCFDEYLSVRVFQSASLFVFWGRK